MIDNPIADVMASGVHDAKNVIFDARTRVAAARAAVANAAAASADVLLREAEEALDLAARGLSVALTAYRLDHRDNPVVLLPVVVADLVDEVALRAGGAPGGRVRLVTTACSLDGVWMFDRELVAESLVNALQNAHRMARTRIRLSADRVGNGLNLRVEDDGPGFGAMERRSSARFSGLGLHVTRRIAALHERGGVRGRLELHDGGILGGAVFSLWLP
jgi:signal transduction histidine kinase